jgi:hypothetical protein
MFSRRSLAFSLASTALVSTSSHSQANLDQSDVSTRIHLAFQVSDAAVQRLLPAGWLVSPSRTGPSRGANLIAVFFDRMILQDGDGKATTETLNHVAVLVVPVRNPAGTQGSMIVYGFSARPDGVPGAYGNFVLADSNMERILRSRGGVRENQEHWSFATPDGERLQLRIRYVPSTPMRSRTETRNFSPVFAGGHYRFYSSDQGFDLLRSTVTGVDRLTEMQFSATGPRLGALFDGSQLISALSIPWQVRQVFVPELSRAAESEREREAP